MDSKFVFTGIYDGVTDDKNRVEIPKKWRTGLCGKWFTALCPGKYIQLYPEDTWKKYLKTLTESSPNDPLLQQEKRTILADTHCIESDRAGRMVLPARWTERAGLQKEILWIGVGDHIELWNKKRYEDYLMI